MDKLQFLRDCLGLLLNLYPKTYREEYGKELQTVFNLSIDAAMKLGRLETVKVVLHELIGLPKAILYEHLRERRRTKMAGKFASRFDFSPGSRTESFAALAPFLLFGALPTLLGYFRVMDFVPLWLDIVSVILFWSFGLGLLLLGFVKRFPRWFMPYIGLPIPVICLFLFIGVIEPKLNHFPFPYRSSWFAREFVSQGVLWVGLFLIVTLLLVSTSRIPKSRPFYQRLRDDWTLLAFIIYGTMPFVLVITYNEYKNVEPFIFLSLVILAGGGRLYLQSYESLKRFLYLYAGVTLSMLVAAGGKAFLLESSFPFVADDSWQTEFMSTIVTWMWLAMMMWIPPALNLLPRSDRHARAV